MGRDRHADGEKFWSVTIGIRPHISSCPYNLQADLALAIAVGLPISQCTPMLSREICFSSDAAPLFCHVCIKILKL